MPSPCCGRSECKAFPLLLGWLSGNLRPSSCRRTIAAAVAVAAVAGSSSFLHRSLAGGPFAPLLGLRRRLAGDEVQDIRKCRVLDHGLALGCHRRCHVGLGRSTSIGPTHLPAAFLEDFVDFGCSSSALAVLCLRLFPGRTPLAFDSGDGPDTSVVGLITRTASIIGAAHEPRHQRVVQPLFIPSCSRCLLGLLGLGLPARGILGSSALRLRGGLGGLRGAFPAVVDQLIEEPLGLASLLLPLCPLTRLHLCLVEATDLPNRKVVDAKALLDRQHLLGEVLSQGHLAQARFVHRGCNPTADGVRGQVRDQPLEGLCEPQPQVPLQRRGRLQRQLQHPSGLRFHRQRPERIFAHEQAGQPAVQRLRRLHGEPQQSRQQLRPCCGELPQEQRQRRISAFASRLRTFRGLAIP
mmetsp:Transcript_141813/g.453083  ORF Transcript_141813/g.453083 Transcript_141813/m.453083 type:complete len:410 (+) Transcript_141813:34-1263(+)